MKDSFDRGVNRGGQASHGFSHFSSFFFFFFSLSLSLSTISRPFDFHGNERFPSKYRIDRRPTKREREPIFSRGTMGTTSVTANGTFRVQTFRSFTSSTSTTTTVKLRSTIPPTTDFLRIILWDRGQPPWWQPAQPALSFCRKPVYCRRWNKVLPSNLKIPSTIRIFLINLLDSGLKKECKCRLLTKVREIYLVS